MIADDRPMPRTDRDEFAIYRDEARGIGSLLSEYQQQAKMSDTACASVVGCSRTTWAAWCRGDRKPVGANAKRIVDRLFPGMAEAFSLHGHGRRNQHKRSTSIVSPPTGATVSEKARKRIAKAEKAVFKRKRRFKIEARAKALKARQQQGKEQSR